MTEAEHAEVIAEIWKGDALNRSKDAEILRTFTVGHLKLRENAGEPRTYVLNLDANWGAGKSFFLSRFKKHLEANGHVAIYVNAWKSDHSEDPFMTVVDEIHTELSARLEAKGSTETMMEKTASLRKSTTKIIGGAVYSGGKHFLTRYIGREAVQEFTELFGNSGSGTSDDSGENQQMIADSIRKSIDIAVDAAGTEMLEQFRQQKEVQENFRKQLAELGSEVLSDDSIIAPIFILIDELDRCRPSYAIELLERVKHIFSLQDFVYILGTDTKQLANAIKGVYGSDFDGERYLKRFIDRTYRFQDAPKGKLIEFALARNGLTDDTFVCLPNYSAITFLSECFEHLNTDARDIRQIIEAIGTFAASWQTSDVKIDLVSLFPIVYQRHFDLTYQDIIDSDLAKIRFSFISFESGGRRSEITLNYSSMWQEIDQQSLENFKRKEPRNSFQNWIQGKNFAEYKALGRARDQSERQETIRTEYSRLLDLVSNLSSPSEGRANQ